MLPGLSAAPLLARSRVVVERRKLTGKKFYTRAGDNHPRRDVVLFSNGKQTKGSVIPTSPLVPFAGGSRYSMVAVARGKQGGFNDSWDMPGGETWQVIAGSWALETFICLGFDLPGIIISREFNSSDILWSGVQEGTGTLSLTVPTSTQISEPVIVAAGYGGFDIAANNGMTTVWDAPEPADITGQNNGEGGIITSIKASLYADGAPPYDIDLRCASGGNKALSAAIVRIPT